MPLSSQHRRTAARRSSVARMTLAATMALAAAGCSREQPLMADASALARAQRSLAALPEFGGRTPQVHAAMLFHDDDIEIALVDPARAGEMHTYRYREGQWRHDGAKPHDCALGPAPRADPPRDMPLDRVAFATAAVVRGNWYARAGGVPGARKDSRSGQLSGVWYFTPGGGYNDGLGGWSTSPIQGEGETAYEISFADDGSVRRFERLR
ncbi:hypothetical protein [Lysobacter sp. CA199]|uniref:hypothetical protein n=1 Tax=Lysobacter sp. CA199 TaxID=3455608 RepID=UPI003F8D804C